VHVNRTIEGVLAISGVTTVVRCPRHCVVLANVQTVPDVSQVVKPYFFVIIMGDEVCIIKSIIGNFICQTTNVGPPVSLTVLTFNNHRDNDSIDFFHILLCDTFRFRYTRILEFSGFSVSDEECDFRPLFPFICFVRVFVGFPVIIKRIVESTDHIRGGSDRFHIRKRGANDIQGMTFQTKHIFLSGTELHSS